jgi:hypothetical protein
VDAHDEKPLPWLKLLDKMQMVESTKHLPILHVKQDRTQSAPSLESLARDLNIDVDGGELEPFFEFGRMSGLLLHFDQPGLLQPQWIVDVLSKVITQRHLHKAEKEHSSHLQRDLQRLKPRPLSAPPCCDFCGATCPRIRPCSPN